MTSNFETLIYEKRNNISYVTLNRPQVLNVYNIRMRDELYQVLGAIGDDSEITVVIFQGIGEKAFCAGADLTEFLTASSPTSARKALDERNIWQEFLRIPQLLIAALHGYVLGTGVEIALFCDIRIASENAQFNLPETGLGIIPGAGGTQNLPRTIGQGKALELILTGRWIGAWEAFNTGLVNQVVPQNKLLSTAESIARQITVFDPTAIRIAKQAVVRGTDMSLADGLKLEKRLARRCLTEKKPR
ncbi:enoyl-CoA hydratase/isomerase family protein [Chloroflexota bacterium]